MPLGSPKAKPSGESLLSLERMRKRSCFFPIAQLSAGLREALIEKNFFGQCTRGEFIRERSRQIQRLRSPCESEQHVPPVQSRPVATEQVYGDRAVNLAR